MKYIYSILPKLYFNIICKNIVNFFQKVEVGYIQTCTSLERRGPKGVTVVCFHPLLSRISFVRHVLTLSIRWKDHGLKEIKNKAYKFFKGQISM